MRTPVSLALLFLLFLSSCSMEKRIYRKGWYMDHPHKTEQAAVKTGAGTDVLLQVQAENIQPDTNNSIHPDTLQTELKTIPDEVINQKQAEKTTVREPLPRMSHREAVARIREKGCTQDAFTATLYNLSYIAIILMIFTGLGIFLSIAVFILSFFAEKGVIESGNCVEENLAILRKARMTSLITMLVTAFLAILLITLFFSLLSFGFSI